MQSHYLVTVVYLLAFVRFSAAYATGSGTCFAIASQLSIMGPQSNSYSIYGLSTSQASYNGSQPFTVSVNFIGSASDPSIWRSIKGLLLYAEDAQGNRHGSYQLSSGFSYKTSCESADGRRQSTLNHNNADFKTLPLSFTFTPPQNGGNLTFRAAVVRGLASQGGQNDWFILDTVTVSQQDFDPNASSGTTEFPVAVAVGVVAGVVILVAVVAFVLLKLRRQHSFESENSRRPLPSGQDADSVDALQTKPPLPPGPAPPKPPKPSAPPPLPALSYEMTETTTE